MTTLSDSYNTFLSIKLHFTKPDYDAVKYKFKTNSKVNLDNHKDKYQYLKFAKKYSNKDLIQFYLANILKDNKIWIGACDEKVFNKWKARFHSLSYHFEDQVKKLSSKFDSLDSLIGGTQTTVPAIINEYKGGRISPETLTIFNILFTFVDNITAPDFVWREEKMVMTKYKSFLSIDKKKYLTILAKYIKK